MGAADPASDINEAIMAAADAIAAADTDSLDEDGDGDEDEDVSSSDADLLDLLGLPAYDDIDMQEVPGPTSEEEEGEAADAGEASEPDAQFDPAVPPQHNYLGDVDDLGMSGQLFEDNHRCTLPLFALPGVVLLPGDTLPMRLVDAGERALAERALAAPVPYNRIVAVVHARRQLNGRFSLMPIGCTAEVRQMRRLEDGTINCVARGRQRLMIGRRRGPVGVLDFTRVPVTIIADWPPLHVPREVRALCTYWGPWAHRPFDAYRLAASAQRLFACLAPKARPFCGDPLELSYWLASNLPLKDETRQQLLECLSAVERLALEVHLMSKMSNLHCRVCGAQIASARDMLVMSEEGTSGVFVNNYGYVHDMVTLRVVRQVVMYGRPETEHSWFPGYAWTIANCRICATHLGWRFTAVRPHLAPAAFFGLRRQAISEGWSEGLTRQPGLSLHAMTDAAAGRPGALSV
ncbi:hypothetical protein WJX72_005161 [[Myrmecia] bisecta]|uniref:Protein cereblon n=1 Tax=[Myrmecia] bisecta TaxID=41462 RepID=A0AAW1PWP7_9CHLO